MEHAEQSLELVIENEIYRFIEYLVTKGNIERNDIMSLYVAYTAYASQDNPSVSQMFPLSDTSLSDTLGSLALDEVDIADEVTCTHIFTRGTKNMGTMCGRKASKEDKCKKHYYQSVMEIPEARISNVIPHIKASNKASISKCIYIFTRGKSSGTSCDKGTKGGDLCSKHRPKSEAVTETVTEDITVSVNDSFINALSSGVLINEIPDNPDITEVSEHEEDNDFFGDTSREDFTDDFDEHETEFAYDE